MPHRLSFCRSVVCRGARALALAAAVLLLPALARGADEDGFKPIFNGNNLDGWSGDPKFWKVEDGAITGQTTKENPTPGNTFCIWRDGNNNNEVDDFVLRADFKIEGGNSGIQFRSKDLGNWVVGGYQADFDGSNGWTGSLYEERGRGVLAKRGNKVVIDSEGKMSGTPTAPEAEILNSVKKGDWNQYEITAAGNHLVQKINGKVTIDITDEQAAKRAMSGILALQVHAGEPMKVQFKNLQLKRLKLSDNRKKIVLVAGTPSHGKGEHEFNAGTLILEALPE